MKKQQNTTNAMPATMHDANAERMARERIVEAENTLRECVKKLQTYSLNVTTATDLAAITPDYIRQGIEQSKAARLNGDFIPTSIRQTWTREFDRMDAELVPVAATIQKTLAAMPLPVVLNDNSLYFDSEAAKKYVRQQSVVTIPTAIRSFYGHLSAICEQWRALLQWCDENEIERPTLRLLRVLSGEYIAYSNDTTDLAPCNLNITPEAMLMMLNYGIVKK